MKKLLSLLVLALMLCSSLTLAETADVTGLWHVSSVVVSGKVYNAAYMDTKLTLELHADGTMELRTPDESDKGTWALKDGAIVITEAEGAETVLTLAEDALVIEMGGISMVFTKEPAVAPEPVEISEPLVAETEEAFEGKWGDAFWVDPDTGSQMALSAVGKDLRLEINGRTVYFYMYGQSMPMICQFENSVLVGSNGNDTIVFARHEGDLLSVTTNGGSMYFRKVVEDTAE